MQTQLYFEINKVKDALSSLRRTISWITPQLRNKEKAKNKIWSRSFREIDQIESHDHVLRKPCQEPKLGPMNNEKRISCKIEACVQQIIKESFKTGIV